MSCAVKPSTILKTAQVRRQHCNIQCKARLMSHAQRQLTPPHHASSANTPPSKHRAGPRMAQWHHHNMTRSTRFMLDARRHPTPPHLCMFCRRTSHQPSSSQPKLEGHIPCSTSLMSHAQSHLTPPQKACSATTQPSKHRASPRKGGIPQQRPTLNEVHAARPKAPDSTPPCMFHHRTSHQPSSSQPKLEGNIATFRAQQGSCRTPKGTRFRPDEHVLAPHAFKT